MTLQLVQAGIAQTTGQVEEQNANFCLYVLSSLKMKNEIYNDMIENT
jgi:hypothetical protein